MLVGAALTTSASALAITVTIRNDMARVDQNADILDAHDGSIARFDGTYYLYGTAYNNQNGFSFSNRFVVYSSPDLVAWTFHGDITTVMDSEWGMYFRPHVVFDPQTQKYVLWYNWYPRGANWNGRFGVATADQPWGPFTVENNNVTFPQGGSVGDFAILADTDGTGWCVYGWHNGGVAPLSSDYLSIGTGYALIGGGEGFSAFKRANTYYYLWGNLCCFCSAGSNAQVSRSTVATGPFTSVGDIIGANIHAQPLGVLQIETATGTQYSYVGDRWQSTPDDKKGHDFLYISEPLRFAANGDIAPMGAFTNSFTVDLAPGVPSPGPRVARNLALGKRATASSSFENVGWGLAHVTDGGNFSVAGTNMGWSSDSLLGANHPEWITVDLGAPYAFDRIVLYPRVGTGGTGTCPASIAGDPMAGAGFPSAFSIESSIDNVHWSTLLSRSGYPAPYIAPQHFSVDATVGRYVRISGTQLAPVNSEYRMQFAEIAVYAAAGATILDGGTDATAATGDATPSSTSDAGDERGGSDARVEDVSADAAPAGSGGSHEAGGADEAGNRGSNGSGGSVADGSIPSAVGLPAAPSGAQGCSCRIAGRRSSERLALSVAAAAATLWLKRRRRRS